MVKYALLCLPPDCTHPRVIHMAIASCSASRKMTGGAPENDMASEDVNYAHVA